MTMSRIEFDKGTLSVTWNGETVALLPKEYELLAYMHRHAGQTLSRDQLLQAVWPLQFPTDRTVDDHVYRVRRKLGMWDPLMRIDTVRSSGYRLVIQPPSPKDNPLHNVPSFAEEMRSIMNTFLRYGRGDALLTLFRNKDMFGIEIESPFQLLIRFMEGDVRSLVEEGREPFADRAFFLLLLYQYINPQENRIYVEEVLRRKILPPVWHNELENIILVSLLMDWDEYENAKEKLDFLAAEVERNDWDGLVPYVANLKLEHALHVQDWEQFSQDLKLAEEKLERYPYQREEGKYFILKGIGLYRMNSQQGLQWIEQGLGILKQSRFLPHWMNGLHTLLVFSERDAWSDIRERYVKEWNLLSRQIGLDELKDSVKRQLQTNLGSL